MSDTGYLGNPMLKRGGTPIEWSPDMLKEYMKCADDPIYFAEQYIKIVHVDHGFIPIEMYDFQKDIVNAISKNRRVVVNASRQAGKCVSVDTLIKIKMGDIVSEITMGGLHELILNGTYTKLQNIEYSNHTPLNNKLSSRTNRKFVEVYGIADIHVLAPTGWEPISHFNITVPYRKYRVEFSSGQYLDCADDHILICENGSEVYAKDCIGSTIQSENGPIVVLSVSDSGIKETMYDLSVDSADHVYYTNGILSHNTTTAVAIILHYILFNEYKTVALLANKAASATEILSRIQLAYEALPSWLQQGIVTWNKGSMELENGCKVLAAASSSSSIRGKSCVTGDTRVCIEDGDDYYFVEIEKIINKANSSK